MSPSSSADDDDATATATAVEVKWTRLRPSPDPACGLPSPRSSHGVSLLGKKRNDGDDNLRGGVATTPLRLVLYGGENVARTPVAEFGQSLWIAEQQRDGDGDATPRCRWISPLLSEDSEPPPSPRVAHAQAAVGSATVYVFGGRGGIEMGEEAKNDLWKLELVENDGGAGASSAPPRARWTRIVPPGPAPEPRSFHKMISTGTHLYVFGGCGAKGRMNDLWRFDTADVNTDATSKNWEQKRWECLGISYALRGRGGSHLLELTSNKSGGANARVAAVAGFAGEETNDGHVYDASESAWDPDAIGGLSELRPRSVGASGTLRSESGAGEATTTCFLFGGEVDPSCRGHEGAGNFESDLVLLDGRTGAFRETILPPPPTTKEDGGSTSWPQSRGWADAAVVFGSASFYLFGGLAGDDATPVRLDDLWECRVRL